MAEPLDAHTHSTDVHRSADSRPASSGSGQTYTLTPTPTPPTGSHVLSYKTDSLLYNKMDERQRLARERREERDKQNALREAAWQQRAERARQRYEHTVEERRRRMEEQRRKEENRRRQVEEKRRCKLEEDKMRHEAVLRRTMEKSQRGRNKTHTQRWSWGGALHTSNTPNTHTGFVPSDFLYPLDLAGLEHAERAAFSPYRAYGMASQYSERRSVSTINLSKHNTEQHIITKRLSSSSATLLHSPDRGLRRLPLSQWENSVVNRLQQPTHSYLARSRSAVSLSGETVLPVCPRSVSCHPMSSVSFKSLTSHKPLPQSHKPRPQSLPHCRSHDANLSRKAAGGASPSKDRSHVRKSWSNLSLPLAPCLSVLPNKPVSKKKSKGTAPSPGRAPQQKTGGRPPTPKQLRSPGVPVGACEEQGGQGPPSPTLGVCCEDQGNMRPSRGSPSSPSPPSGGSGGEELSPAPPAQPRPQPVGQNEAGGEQAPAERPAPPGDSTVGSMDPEEAYRHLLAEKRRQAREQREREEEERRRQEEQARLAREELARRKAWERARREEEERRRSEEEREEAERLQRQKEEEECRQKEEAERLRQEREKHFLKEEAERLERKRRLEEIMKRTRRSDTTDRIQKVSPQRNGEDAGSAAASTLSPSASQQSDSNGHQAPHPVPGAATLPPSERSENGDFEEVIQLPDGTATAPPQEGSRVPVVAFRENGLLKAVGGTEEVPTQLPTQPGADVV